jgi:hypothetical protein
LSRLAAGSLEGASSSEQLLSPHLSGLSSHQVSVDEKKYSKQLALPTPEQTLIAPGQC